jgi:hypothetical protein
MLKPRFLCLRYVATMLILCLILFTACQEPSNNPDNKAGTWVEFNNLEQFPVTIYSDPARQVVFAEVTANGTKKVAAVSNSMGTAFYPTFKLDLFNNIPGISVPYNGPHIIAVIEADKTNIVPIPKLTSVETYSAYIKLTNNSNSSLTLRQGNAEKSPLGGGSTVISAGQNAAYEIAPGAVSGYSIMHNTTTPIAFPAGLTEFKAGVIYALNYNGTTLRLFSQNSVLSSIPPTTPENVTIEAVSSANMRITWNEVSGAVSYCIYRATGSSTASYTQIGTSNVTFYNDTSITTGQTYFYKVSALNSANKESAQSTAVSVITPPSNVWVITVTTISVSLAWNAYTGATGYNLYRSSAEEGTYSKINSAAISETTFIDTDVAAYTAYWYKVSVIVSGLESFQSSPISVSTGTIVYGNDLAAKLDWLKNNAASNYLYSIEINTDENIVPQTLYYSGKSGITISLSGNGTMRTVSLSAQGSLFTINSGVTLILDNNITLNGRSSNNSPLVCINSGGTLVMNMETKITGNSSSGYGGGVYLYDNSTFTMNGGEISGNTAYSSGGVMNKGTFTMNGGKISGNTASYGSGVLNDVNGTFSMNDGEISGNTATGRNSINGGSGGSGGGVYIYSDRFYMNGGKISGNNASDSNSIGGGVFVDKYGSFIMKDGEISGNTAYSGGGVYTYYDSRNYYGYFSMGGGVIYGNNAAAGLKNTATNGAALYKGYSSVSSSIAQYGTYSGNSFYKSGDLSTTNNTIRIVNGSLLTE